MRDYLITTALAISIAGIFIINVILTPRIDAQETHINQLASDLKELKQHTMAGYQLLSIDMDRLNKSIRNFELSDEIVDREAI